MIVSLSVAEWQILRVLVRAEAKKQYPTGRELRLNMSRRSKDGTFLDELVALKLITVAEKPASNNQSPSWGKPEPAQFRTRYKLTDLGRHAAEFGEYDRPFTPSVVDVTGLAAQLATSNTATNKPTTRKSKK